MSRTPLKLLFLVTEDWYFATHRLQLARAVRDAGAEVAVMTHFNELYSTLAEEGFTLIPWHLSRRSLNPLREAGTFLQVVQAYRRERPDLVHHIALKPTIYGGCAARLLGGIPSVNAIAGMGHVFMSTAWPMRFLRYFLLILLRIALRNEKARALFQNEENRSFLIEEGVVSPYATDVIPGTGVNVTQFTVHPEPCGPPVVLLASRMLWDKGIGEFVEAAALLRRTKLPARFVLVGKPDPENPGSVSQDQLESWSSDGLVEWWGHQKDMSEILSQASVVCLPSSYGEGVPRVLIEAAACGRPIIATDAPGCRDIVRHGHNGLLVPLHDAAKLAQAIETLIANPGLRANLGARGRELAVREFSEERVFAQIMEIYQRLLGPKWTSMHPNLPEIEELASTVSKP
jgi:glycosyltransferase involved in cell wall biosynthesis